MLFPSFPPLPPLLIISTGIFVFVPSIMTLYYRWNLYQHLTTQANKIYQIINKRELEFPPTIVEVLEQSFAESSQNLEQVNTAALIDQAYSQEKVLGKSCEQIEYWCRIIPNLLLAFGLIGTFIGITVNLGSLSHTISQSQATDVSQLVEELKEPLEGMAIAFITSLAGLLCSALLTVLNFLWNTSLAKYRLTVSLEHYLDNVYYSSLNGQTRLDKVVKGMSSEFKDFLDRFGITVREAVESAMRDNIHQITKANVEASELALQVYSQLSNATGTLERGAREFQTATESFTNAVQVSHTTAEKLEQVAQGFEQSEFPKQLSRIATDFGENQKNFSDSAFGLFQTVQSLETILNQLQTFTEQLVKTEAKLSEINQSSLQVLELNRINQQSLVEIIPQLQQGGKSLELSSQTLENIQNKVIDKSDYLEGIDKQLEALVKTLNSYTNTVNFKLESLSKMMNNLIKKQSNSSQSHSQVLADKLEAAIKPNIKYIIEMKSDLSQVLKLLKEQSGNKEIKNNKPKFW